MSSSAAPSSPSPSSSTSHHPPPVTIPLDSTSSSSSSSLPSPLPSPSPISSSSSAPSFSTSTSPSPSYVIILKHFLYSHLSYVLPFLFPLLLFLIGSSSLPFIPSIVFILLLSYIWTWVAIKANLVEEYRGMGMGEEEEGTFGEINYSDEKNQNNSHYGKHQKHHLFNNNVVTHSPYVSKRRSQMANGTKRDSAMGNFNPSSTSPSSPSSSSSFLSPPPSLPLFDKIFPPLPPPLPLWLTSPDVQRSKWLNDILLILYPKMKIAIESDVKKVLLPILNPLSHMIKLIDFDFGNSSPFVSWIKHYNTNDDSIMMDLNITIPMDPKITLQIFPIVKYPKLSFFIRIRRLTVCCTVRVMLEDFVAKFPPFRKLSFCLSHPPSVSTDVRIFGINVMEIPLLRGVIQHVITAQVGKTVQFPTKITIPMGTETAEEIALRENSEPKGQLVIHLIGCTNLSSIDFLSRKSDPYVKIILESTKEEVRSDVIEKTLNPHYDKYFEFTIYNLNDSLHLSVFDYDKVSIRHRKLGDIHIPLISLQDSPFQEIMTPLQNCDKGDVQMELEYREFAVKSEGEGEGEDGEEEDGKVDGTGKNNNSTSDLFNKNRPTLNSAPSLSASMPSTPLTSSSSRYVLFCSHLRGIDLGVDECYLKLRVGFHSRKTSLVKPLGNEHQWSEKYQYPIGSLQQEMLVIEVKYKGNASRLLDKTTGIATLGLLHTDVGIKSKVLGEVVINMRDVGRSGRLAGEFNVNLPEGTKVDRIKPKIFLHVVIRELAVGRQASQMALRPPTAGTLTVKLLEGSDLVAADRGNTSDPFATLTVGSQSFTSQKVLKTLHPTWNEKFTFNIHDFYKDNLFVKVFDYDRFGSNTPLGDCNIPLRIFRQKLSEGNFTHVFALDHIEHGSIQMELDFVDTNGKRIEAPAAGSVSSLRVLTREETRGSLKLKKEKKGMFGFGGFGNMMGTMGMGKGKEKEGKEGKKGEEKGKDGSEKKEGKEMEEKEEGDDDEDGEVEGDGAGEKKNNSNETDNGQKSPKGHSVSPIHPDHQKEEKDKGTHPSSSSSLISTPSKQTLTVSSSSPSPHHSTPTTPHNSQHTPNSPSRADPQSFTMKDGNNVATSMSASHSRSPSLSRLPSVVHHDPSSVSFYLLVTVVQATNLSSSHKDNTCDSYVKVSFGRSKFHTKVVKRSAEPVFGDTFRVPVHQNEVDIASSLSLSVRVKEHRTLRSGELKGSVEFKLSELIKRCPEPLSIFELSNHEDNASQGNGQIVLTIKIEREMEKE